jgi:hypothetical protein
MIRKSFQKLGSRKEKGQILVLFVLLFVVLIGIIGLAVDLGDIFVAYSRLGRAVDAAALSATSQFREGYSIVNIVKEARQFLELNGIHDVVSISVEACENAIVAGDPELCTTPPKKVVRVTVVQNVRLYFLPIIGYESVPIRVDAISEAASVDLVLLIDTSSSMAQTALGGEADPYECNNTDPTGVDGYPGECHPMEEIKEAAILLVDHLFLSDGVTNGFDRVAIVTYDRFPKVQLEMTDDQALIETTLRNLTVYQGERSCQFEPGDWIAAEVADEGPCRSYNLDGTYWGLWSPLMEVDPSDPFDIPDPRGWMVTNSGGGLKVTANLLGGRYPTNFPRTTPPSRQDALWVVVWLTDGFTNAGFVSDGGEYNQTILNSGAPFCPAYTWNPPGSYPGGGYTTRYCVDQDARDPLGRHPASNPATYDPDDYARDMVDFLTGTTGGQGALLYTIGEGTNITNRSGYEVANNYPAPGESLLQYAAEKGGGIYYAVPNASQLNKVFLAIANNIATRLSR